MSSLADSTPCCMKMKAYLFASILLFGLCSLVLATPKVAKQNDELASPEVKEYKEEAADKDAQNEANDEMEFEEPSELTESLDRIEKAGLTLKPVKCQWLRRSVKFLGHIVSEEGVTVDPAKVSSVKNFPIPQNKTDVRSFLGLTGYYRRFIADSASRSKPLVDLTKNKRLFQWTKDADDTLEKSSPTLFIAANKRERANKYNGHALEEDEFDDEDDLMQDEPRDEMEFREESPQSLLATWQWKAE
eukprot:gene9279-10258_t